MQLRQLAQQFCDRMCAEHAALQAVDADLLSRLLFELGRAVRAATRESHRYVLTQIENLAAAQYKQLSSREKALGIGRKFHAISELAKRHDGES